MNTLLLMIIAAAIVGIVTAGLKIRFDRFFTIIMLALFVGITIKESVNIVLWVILFGSAWILYVNRNALKDMPQDQLKKRLLIIPLLTIIFTFIGSYFYYLSSSKILLIALAVLAILYGLRLIFIHFKEHEHNYPGNPTFEKLCAFLGPAVSGTTMGFIGTSLKPLKIPFAVKTGKLSMKKVYLGNVMTAFFAALFAIIWHFTIFLESSNGQFITSILYGVGFFIITHFTYEGVNYYFKENWRKVFQIIIGIMLLLVSIKIFLAI